MKTNHQDRIAYTVIVIVTFLIGVISFFFLSCTTTKKVDKQTEVITLTEKLNIDSVVKTKVDSVVKHFEEYINSLEADVVFADCDTVRLPGETKIVNTVSYVPGKGIVATGNIKQFKLKQEELVKLLDEAIIEKENEINLRVEAERKLKEEIEKKKVEIKRRWFPWWLLIVAYVLGVYFPPVKIFSLFKKVI